LRETCSLKARVQMDRAFSIPSHPLLQALAASDEHAADSRQPVGVARPLRPESSLLTQVFREVVAVCARRSAVSKAEAVSMGGGGCRRTLLEQRVGAAHPCSLQVAAGAQQASQLLRPERDRPEVHRRPMSVPKHRSCCARLQVVHASRPGLVGSCPHRYCWHPCRKQPRRCQQQSGRGLP